MSKVVHFRVEEALFPKLEELARKREKTVGEYFTILANRLVYMQELAKEAVDPVAACATCNRFFYEKDKDLQNKCVKDGHFVLPL